MCKQHRVEREERDRMDACVSLQGYRLQTQRNYLLLGLVLLLEEFVVHHLYSGTNTQRVKARHCRAVSPSRISHLDALLLLDRYAEVRHAGDVNLDDLSAVPGSV